MGASEWSTTQRPEHNIEINDGTLRYYTRRGKYDGYGLHGVARDFARTYDHNGIEGEVECVVTNLTTGRALTFTV